MPVDLPLTNIPLSLFLLRRHQWYEAATQDDRPAKIALGRSTDKENDRQLPWCPIHSCGQRSVKTSSNDSASSTLIAQVSS